MTFVRYQAVLWKGAPCTVVAVSGSSVALTRDRDAYTVITTADILAGHQPAPAKLPPAPNLGAS